MAVSQNLRFKRKVKPDPEFDHPAGASISRTLTAELKTRGWKVDEFDNWRDSGWFFHCEKGSASLEVSYAQIENESNWFLQIAPTYFPGILGNLFGKKPSATPQDCSQLSKDIHAILTSINSFSTFQWCWDHQKKVNQHRSHVSLRGPANQRPAPAGKAGCTPASFATANEAGRAGCLPREARTK